MGQVAGQIPSDDIIMAARDVAVRAAAVIAVIHERVVLLLTVISLHARMEVSFIVLRRRYSRPCRRRFMSRSADSSGVASAARAAAAQDVHTATSNTTHPAEGFICDLLSTVVRGAARLGRVVRLVQAPRSDRGRPTS